MSRELTYLQQLERSVTKKYRRDIWNKFISALQDYRLIDAGDRIAVCISGGKDSMLLAVLMRLLQQYSNVPFELVYLVMDPGYSPENRRLIEENAARLCLPIDVFETDIFGIVDRAEKYPCYLCARMRRGHLYRAAMDRGCNKIALGHHMSDVIETTVMSMFYGSQLQCMAPRLRSSHFEGMELIRPLYRVHEDSILAWQRYNGLQFLRCACRATENIALCPDGVGDSKRAEVKALLRELRRSNPNIEKSIFHSIHDVHLDTFPGYRTHGEKHSFLDRYDD